MNEDLISFLTDEHNYLVKYSLIKEENGYIFLKMREYNGNLNYEDNENGE